VVEITSQRRAVGYIRVSTEDQAREGISLDAQQGRIVAYCTAKGWNLLRVYRDEASGKDLHRPGIQALIRDLKGDGVDVVVIVKLDRLTRNVRDLGTLIGDLFDGVALASVDESLDSSTASGRMVMNLLGTVAQWEREVIGERTKFALDHKRTKGEWAAGRIPYGFRIGEDGKLAEDPDQMANIVAMKRARRRGASIRSLAKRYGVSVGTVHKVTTTDLRVIRSDALA
jgi:DNA invertase Pin-like site-specific DNA recombinase